VYDTDRVLFLIFRLSPNMVAEAADRDESVCESAAFDTDLLYSSCLLALCGLIVCRLVDGGVGEMEWSGARELALALQYHCSIFVFACIVSRGGFENNSEMS